MSRPAKLKIGRLRRSTWKFCKIGSRFPPTCVRSSETRPPAFWKYPLADSWPQMASKFGALQDSETLAKEEIARKHEAGLSEFLISDTCMGMFKEGSCLKANSPELS